MTTQTRHLLDFSERVKRDDITTECKTDAQMMNAEEELKEV